MLEQLKQEVYDANQMLYHAGLITLTWGNASEIDRDSGKIVIKPSGISYESMVVDQMVVTDLEGHVLAGDFRPSSDLKTHIKLYNAFPKIRGIVHTHSRYATAFAQAESTIQCYGTTHADTFFGNIPCTRQLTDEEIASTYERNTGEVIIETFQNLDYMAVPGVLVGRHGPITWGNNAKNAVENAIVLEEVAHIAYLTNRLCPSIKQVKQSVMDKHYFRKHGSAAYYGQR